jgi:hypothetical protein
MTAAAFRLPDPSALPAARLQAPGSLHGFGCEALDSLLPAAGLPAGSLIEIRSAAAGAGATSLALRACRVAQMEQKGRRCAFLDPSGTLFAPGVARLGVDLERLIVVRPRWDALESVASRVVESRIVSLLVIDLRGSPSPALQPANDAGLLGRLALVSEGLGTTVLLLAHGARTDEPLASSVTLRLTLTRTNEHTLQIAVAARASRVATSRTVPWSLISAQDEATFGARRA